jgi:hypothetical protein
VGIHPTNPLTREPQIMADGGGDEQCALDVGDLIDTVGAWVVPPVSPRRSSCIPPTRRRVGCKAPRRSAFGMISAWWCFHCESPMRSYRAFVASEKGAWLPTSPTGQTISAFVSADDRADLSEGACYNDTAVEVAAAWQGPSACLCATDARSVDPIADKRKDRRSRHGLPL